MKFKSVEKVHQGKFVTRYDITYETEKGNIKRYEMLSRNPDITDFDGIKSDKSEAVVLIMHDKDNSKILLNKEYRMAVGNVAINFPAGIIDPCEDAKTAAGRELWEETGLNVKNIKYYKSQPWGVADDILTGFFCELDGSDKITRDEQELAVAEWTKREDVVLQPDQFSLTNEMMTLFKEGREPID